MEPSKRLRARDFWRYQRRIAAEAWRGWGTDWLIRIGELLVAAAVGAGVGKVTGVLDWEPVLAVGAGFATWLIFYGFRCAVASVRIHRDQEERIHLLQGGLTESDADKRNADRAKLLLVAKSVADSWCLFADRQRAGESPDVQTVAGEFARLKNLLEGSDWEAASRYWAAVSTMQVFLSAGNSAAGLVEVEKVYGPMRTMLYIIDAEEQWERSRRSLSPTLPPSPQSTTEPAPRPPS